MSSNTDALRPGEAAPKSGQYEEVGPRGGGTGHEVTVPKGHTMPPTTEPGVARQRDGATLSPLAWDHSLSASADATMVDHRR